MNTNSTLNVDELLHLALHATNHDTPDKAIAYLKELLTIDPKHAQAMYLLGALHAEIGMHDLAAQEMTRALELGPDLPATARFQLGLLHITAGRISEAESAWQPLIKLGEDDPLYLFKSGMLHLVNDQFTEAAEALRQGIEVNTINEDLNNDMRRVLADAEHAAGIAPITSDNVSIDQTQSGKRMLLSIYERDES